MGGDTGLALCFAVWKVVFKYPLGLYGAGRFAVQLVSLIRRGEDQSATTVKSAAG